MVYKLTYRVICLYILLLFRCKIMKLDVYEYDGNNESHRRLLSDTLPHFQKEGVKTQVFIFEKTNEYVILDVSNSPELVWIDYMHIHKTFDRFISAIEEILKTKKVQAIRYCCTYEFSPHRSVLIRNVNTLIYNKYTVKELRLRLKDEPMICMQKILSRRLTGSITVLPSIDENSL